MATSPTPPTSSTSPTYPTSHLQEPTLTDRISLAEHLHRLGLSRLAEHILERASREAPQKTALLRRLAEMTLQRGDAALAVRISEQALRDDDDPANHLVAAEASLAARNLEQAADRYSDARTRCPTESELTGRILAGAARVAYLQGNHDEATALLQEALGRMPLPAEHLRLLGDLGGTLPSWRTLQHRIEALRREHAELSAPHYLLARLLAAAQARHAPGIPNAEIERLLKIALERDPGDHDARLMLALRQARRRFLSEDAREAALASLKFLSQALRLKPDTQGVDAGLIDLLIASMLDEKPGTATQAVDFYLAGLRRLPGHSVASNNLGVLYLARGELSAARRWFLAALAASPHYDPAYLNLVRTLDLAASPEQIAREVETLVAKLSAPSTVVTGRIVAAMAEDARNQVFEALHARGLSSTTCSEWLRPG